MSKSKNIFISAAIVATSLVVSFSIIAQAAPNDNISYPIAELGNCGSKEECKNYCNKKENINACIDFGLRNNLMSEDEAKIAKKFDSINIDGPGGCADAVSCEDYCDDVSHIDECIAFAEENDILEEGELAEAKKIQAALSKGIQMPGGCTNKNSCDTYCNDPTNMRECMFFAKEAGFLHEDEEGEIELVLKAIDKGVMPPPCRGKGECDAYCSEPNHFNECIAFAEAAGLMPQEEINMIKKTGGKGPGGCQGKDSCDTYCEDPEHFNECADFAEEYGFITKEEAAMSRKTGGKGPGNCKGEEECRTYCDNPDNQEACYEFAVEHSLLSEEERKMMREGVGNLQRMISESSPEIIECFKSRLGEDYVEKMKKGEALPTERVSHTVQSCFEEHFIGESENFIEEMPTDGHGDNNEELREGFEDRFKEEFKRRLDEGYKKPEHEMMQYPTQEEIDQFNSGFIPENVPREIKDLDHFPTKEEMDELMRQKEEEMKQYTEDNMIYEQPDNSNEEEYFDNHSTETEEVFYTDSYEGEGYKKEEHY